MLIINITVCSRVFPFSDVWSGGFVGFRVMTGQPALDFAYPPVPVILSACGAVLLLYVLCGIINMLTALLTDRESAAFFTSLFAGISLGLLNMTIASNGIPEQLLRCIVLGALCFIAYGACIGAVKKKNFGGKKLYWR